MPFKSFFNQMGSRPRPQSRPHRRLAVPPGLAEELTALEGQIMEKQAPEDQAPLFNRAGDLCAQCDRREIALGFYDRAIDGFLRAQRYELARALCRKLVRLEPHIVRARSTLAWLAIRGERRADAEHEVEDYVDAALAAFVEDLAAKHLIAMEKATADAHLRESIALQLISLGAHRAADVLLRSLYAERNGGRPRRHGVEARRSWERALDQAILAKPEPWRQALRQVEEM
ncbi:MAG: hypothetical protein ACRELV_07055 [Longimicrobiales bacterium]